ncbi:unnamed protein product [Parajaminaea phylloscopi]
MDRCAGESLMPGKVEDVVLLRCRPRRDKRLGCSTLPPPSVVRLHDEQSTPEEDDSNSGDDITVQGNDMRT